MFFEASQSLDTVSSLVKLLALLSGRRCLVSRLNLAHSVPLDTIQVKHWIRPFQPPFTIDYCGN